MPKKEDAAPETENPIPPDYRELIGDLADDPAYIAAWEYAKSKNPDSNKACMIYADLHWDDHILS